MFFRDRTLKNLLFYERFCVRFLNDILKKPFDKQIKSLGYNCQTVIGHGAERKDGLYPKDVVLDIFVTTDTKEHVIIEVQQNNRPDLLSRFQYYLVQVAANRVLRRHDTYNSDFSYKLICIHSCPLFPTDRLLLHWKERENQDPNLISATGFEKYFFRPRRNFDLCVSDPLCFWNHIAFCEVGITTPLENELARTNSVYAEMFREIRNFTTGKTTIHHHQLSIEKAMHLHLDGQSWEKIKSLLGFDDSIMKLVRENVELALSRSLTVVAPADQVGVKIGNPVSWNENAPNPAAVASRPAEPSYQQPRQQNGNNFGVQPKVEPKSQTGTSTAMSTVLPPDIDANVVPIRDVNPYTGKVTIRARVTSKGDIKTWSNSKGEGKLFSMDLLDDSGEIRMTGFNQSVDAFYDLIQMNNVYYISKFSVKPANKSFNSTNHEYEISFAPDSAVYPCLQDTSDIPTLQFNFAKIADIENMAVDSLVDVIGVVKTYGDLSTFTAKTSGRELKKRELTIVDTSCKEIALTLWGKAAESFCDDSQPVVAVKGAKVGEYQGKNLSLLGSSTLQINPDLPECHQLRGWFDNEGANATTQSLRTGGSKGGSGKVKLSGTRSRTN